MRKTILFCLLLLAVLLTTGTASPDSSGEGRPEYTRLDEITGKNIGVITGFDEVLDEEELSQKNTFTYYPTATDTVMALKAGRVDDALVPAIQSGKAALAMGYSKAQTFWKIVFPQAARHFLPVLKGEFISMVKMTSVVGYVAVGDLTKASDLIRSRTMDAFFPLIATAVIYFAVANLLTSALTLAERSIPRRRAAPRSGCGITAPPLTRRSPGMRFPWRW